MFEFVIRTLVKSSRDIDATVLKANGITDRDTPVINAQKDAETPKLDMSSIIEAKVGKLVEAKIAEMLGS